MNLSNYCEPKPHHKKRVVWLLMNRTIFKLLIGSRLRKLRIRILRGFGAEIPLNALVYPSVRIFAPWLLKMGEYSCIGPNVEIYNKAEIEIGDHTVISQGARLFTASHDISSPNHTLITRPILVRNKAWIAAEAFIGMGVTVGEGAVVGACAAVFKDVEPWTVVGGNPAKFIKKRIIKDA